MLVDFNSLPEMTIPGMNGGTGTMSAKMYRSDAGKVIPTRIHKDGSIGMHPHPTSDDLNYVLSGTGEAICDGVTEKLYPGVLHVCKKGSSHSIVNTGENDLVLLTIVIEK